MVAVEANTGWASCCVTNVSNAVELQVNRNNGAYKPLKVFDSRAAPAYGRAWTLIEPGAHGYLAHESLCEDNAAFTLASMTGYYGLNDQRPHIHSVAGVLAVP